jgi:hypothetical protein
MTTPPARGVTVASTYRPPRGEASNQPSRKALRRRGKNYLVNGALQTHARIPD